MKYESKILKIDSSKEPTYYNSYGTSFLFICDPPITVQNEDVIIYSLLNVWIPYSFFIGLINIINIWIYQKQYLVWLTFTIQAGNYDAYTFGKYY